MTGETVSAPVVSTAADEAPATVPLNQFCAGHSAQDKRVELISGFHSDELRNARHHDTPSAYLERFKAFATRPVK